MSAVRTFEGRAAARVFQLAEASATPAAAHGAFETALGWYAGCVQDRAQLVTTRKVGRLGDEAMLVQLRTWDRPAATVVAGIARTGAFTTTTVSRAPGTGKPRLSDAADLLAAAVTGLCTLPQAGSCPDRPVLRAAPPVPVGPALGMLTEVDLPPVAGVDRPWVGTDPQPARDNDAATTCDRTDFDVPAVTGDLTRTFLVPGAGLPAQFGLTETLGSLSEGRARAMVAAVRARLAACPRKEIGTKVTRIGDLRGPHRELSVWHVRTDISKQASMSFLMGIARDRTAVAQVGFVPAQGRTMSDAAFVALVRRALERLPAVRS